MEWLGWMGWILAAAAGGAALYLSRRVSELSRRQAPAAAGGPGGAPPGAAVGKVPGAPPRDGGDAPPSASPQPAGGSGPGAGDARSSFDQEEEALRQALGFLDRAVRGPVEEARRMVEGGPAAGVLERALDAMGDLAFLAAPPPDEPLTRENLATVVQEAIREYTIETRIPVRLHAPSTAVHVQLRRESLKDAVFLVLANAGRFSEGRPIDVYLESLEDGGFRIRVVDEGPGFTDEALERALEPFWSTDPLGVGMGLPQARSRIATMKGRLSLRNQPPKGGEVVLDFPER